MNCEHARAEVLDRGGALAAQAHLADCAACTAWVKSVDAAERLEGVVPVAPRPARARVLGRASLVGLVLVVGAVGVSLHGASRPSAPVAEPVPLAAPVLPETARVLAPGKVEAAPAPSPDEVAQAEWRALVGLRDAVAYESRRDVRVVDDVYVSFGSWPAWVAPAAPRPMRSLGVAVPLVGDSVEE
jgi:hypothetical protein